MQYAAHLPHPPQVFVVGAAALLIGAGGAVAIQAIADNDVALPDVQALVTPQTSATHDEGAAAAGIAGPAQTAVTHDESATAAGISAGARAEAATLPGKNESATATVIGGARP